MGNVKSIGKNTTVFEIVDYLNENMNEVSEVCMLYRMKDDQAIYSGWSNMDSSILALMTLYLQDKIIENCKGE